MRLMSKMAFGIMVNGTGHGQLRLANNTGHPDGFSYQKYLWGPMAQFLCFLPAIRISTSAIVEGR